MLASSLPQGTGRKLTREASRLGSTIARLKLKGIDGDLHNQWSMWFNSRRTEEPYLDLTCYSLGPQKCRLISKQLEKIAQVLHGRRQIVPWGVPLSGVTSATPAVC